VLLDQLAERTRALSSYVRPDQNLEAKVTSFFNKIHHPVLTNLKLSTRSDVRLVEVYPPQLPDLFHGDQLVVLARYQGSGHAAIALEGKLGPHDKQFVYELNFRQQSIGKPFVEELWARRKVGYLLDQIRLNGEKKELVDEVVRLATSYGITTPYTSYLIMPDAPLQLAADGRPYATGASTAGRLSRSDPPALSSGGLGGGGFGGAGGRAKLEDFARRVQSDPGDLGKKRGAFQDQALDASEKALAESAARPAGAPDVANQAARERLQQAKELKTTLDRAYYNYQSGQLRANHVDKQGVNLAQCTNELKCQTQLKASAVRRVASRNCLEFGGVWIDEAFGPRTPTLAIKAHSDAYFRILARQPQMKAVFTLGNHVVWIAPNGSALVIDTADGKDQISDREIDELFASK